MGQVSKLLSVSVSEVEIFRDQESDAGQTSVRDVCFPVFDCVRVLTTRLNPVWCQGLRFDLHPGLKGSTGSAVRSPIVEVQGDRERSTTHGTFSHLDGNECSRVTVGVYHPRHESLHFPKRDPVYRPLNPRPVETKGFPGVETSVGEPFRHPSFVAPSQKRTTCF